ncbi:RNA-directed DNA polymerase [bacterium]|nr:RNA-directed DNA polymerase [bacterium]
MYYNGNKVYLTQKLYYTVCRIGKRVILAPCDELKKKQKYFKTAINWVYPLKMNTFKAAKIHCGKKYILKMDIKDFYGSVPYSFIKQVIKNVCKRIKNADINYYLMITTVEDKLPTGAPTSAHIANACFSPIDKRIRDYSLMFGVDYSRYMDDLTFSCDDKDLLNMIEKFVQKTLTNFGYKLNDKKTKYISDNKQQNVLGLVVNNDTVRMSKDFRRKLRAMIHSYSVCKSSGSKEIDLKYRTWDENSLAKLKGYLAYTKQVDTKTYYKLMHYAKSLNVNL